MRSAVALVLSCLAVLACASEYPRTVRLDALGYPPTEGSEALMLIGFAGFGSGQLFDEPSVAWDVPDRAVGRPTEFLDTIAAEYGAALETIPEIERAEKFGHLARARRRAQDAIRDWMQDDESQGGDRSKNIIIIANSWGASNSAAIARWFLETYEVNPRMHVMIEGVASFPVPFQGAYPADLKLNYYSTEEHWPRGAALAGAENITFSLTMVRRGARQEIPWDTYPRGTTILEGYGTTTQVWRVVTTDGLRRRGGRKYLEIFDVVGSDRVYVTERGLTNRSRWSAHISAEWAGGLLAYPRIKAEAAQ